MKGGSSFKSGFVAIIGKPNVGKSTVMNALIGKKIAITSHKPGTTREKILGILNRPGSQLVFMDTPGLRKPSLLFDRKMMESAKEGLASADLILLIVDAFGLEKEDRYVFSLLPSTVEKKIPVFLLINKVDRIDKKQLLPLIDELSRVYSFQEIIPISALKGDNMKVLLEKSLEALPEGPRYYPEEMVTEASPEFGIKELIREKILGLTHQEVPYSVAVWVEEMAEREDGLLTIQATLFVERPSQKSILIGRKGQMVREIGERARRELEKVFQRKIFLSLWVKVLKDWRQDEKALRRLGYLK